MPNNPINKVVYGNDVLMDLTEDTVEPKTLVLGTTAHDRSGAPIAGTFDPSVYVEKAGDTMTGALRVGTLQDDHSFTSISKNMIMHRADGLGSLNKGTVVINSEYIRIDNEATGTPTGKVTLRSDGSATFEYTENNTSKEINLPADLALSSGTATRNSTNATAGTCNWYKAGRVVTVTVTGVALTADAANNSDIFTGLPEANEQINCIAMGNTSGCTRWYVTTGGALRVGAMALRNQTIYLNFSYISAS